MLSMHSLQLVLLVVLLALTLASAAAKTKKKEDSGLPCQKYLDMSDEDLFFAASDGRRIGEYCRVKNSPNAACEFSVVAEPSAATGYDGWPRTYEDRGRGCVYHPTGRGKCLFGREDYRHWPEAERTNMCSGTYVHNAAAQLRHAIVNDACGGSCHLPSCSADHYSRPYCYHCRKCKDNFEQCKEGYKFCKLCKEECPQEYEMGERKSVMGDEF